MRISISIRDELIRAADELAEELGITRSGLYTLAVAEFVAKFRQADLTAQLNRVYAKSSSALPADIRRAQARILAAQDW